jgi:large conductance mechanosensitive channel
MKSLIQEFKDFAVKGNVIDLAVGLAIGAAFQKIVSSLVNDIIFPAFAPFLNVANFSDWVVNGVLIGNFIKNVVDFLIIAISIFLVVKVINKFKKSEAKKEEKAKAVEINKQEELLREIRDILKKN